ncbi:hypothetical protein CCHR01_08111 [Colletotrichum chrysophilum]|uniref:Uncharacterized protein n=1 Tax=Colletotrichum chrysophilum TaxID=1836956 RepID=A0AAD9AM15_9PEZI|nr:hypothetical protein CCHR01_08111 [Colletotrichum chrysophilum]
MQDTSEPFSRAGLSGSASTRGFDASTCRSQINQVGRESYESQLSTNPIRDFHELSASSWQLFCETVEGRKPASCLTVVRSAYAMNRSSLPDG